MDIINALLCAVTGSGVTAIILALLQRKWAKDDKQDAVVDGLKVLTIDRVRYLGKCYIADGEITLEDKENLEEMHRGVQSPRQQRASRHGHEQRGETAHCPRRQGRSMKKRDKYLLAAIVNLTWYCVAVLVLTAFGRSAPDSLTVAWFAAWATELALLAGIKIKGKDD